MLRRRMVQPLAWRRLRPAGRPDEHEEWPDPAVHHVLVNGVVEVPPVLARRSLDVLPLDRQAGGIGTDSGQIVDPRPVGGEEPLFVEAEHWMRPRLRHERHHRLELIDALADLPSSLAGPQPRLARASVRNLSGKQPLGAPTAARRRPPLLAAPNSRRRQVLLAQRLLERAL